MAYRTFTVEQFAGLRLLQESSEARGALSMLNVDLSRDRTEIRARGGLTELGTGTGTYYRARAHEWPPTSAPSRIVTFRNSGSAVVVTPVVVSDGEVEAINTFGGATSRVTSVIQQERFLRIAVRAGAANGEAHQWHSGTFVLAGLSSSPRYWSWTPTGRLAQAHFTAAAGPPSGSDGTTSTIFFSGGDSSSPLWGDDDWVALDPNDGDEITGMVLWRSQLVVIKRRRLYVFYDEGVDVTGGAVFHYREVDLPSRARVTTNGGGENIVAADDGVYLFLDDGMYRWAGGGVELVSRDITPLFDGTGDSSMVFPDSGDWTIGFAANRVYLSYTVNSTYRTLVYDTLLREWMLWDLSAGQSVVPSNVVEWQDDDNHPTTYIVAGSKVLYLTETGATDDGTAIPWHYQSGFYPVQDDNERVSIRQTHLWGTGAVTVNIFEDHATSDPLGRTTSVTLGTAPAVARGTYRKSHRGRLFSFKLASSSAGKTIHRVSHDL